MGSLWAEQLWGIWEGGTYNLHCCPHGGVERLIGQARLELERVAWARYGSGCCQHKGDVFKAESAQDGRGVELWRRGEAQGQGTKECHQGGRKPEGSGASRATGRECMERKGCLAEGASQVRSENYPWRIDLRNMEAVSVLTRGMGVLGQEKVGRGAQDIRSW